MSLVPPIEPSKEDLRRAAKENEATQQRLLARVFAAASSEWQDGPNAEEPVHDSTLGLLKLLPQQWQRLMRQCHLLTNGFAATDAKAAFDAHVLVRMLMWCWCQCCRGAVTVC